MRPEEKHERLQRLNILKITRMKFAIRNGYDHPKNTSITEAAIHFDISKDKD